MIKNIIFDLGDVFVDLDKSNTQRALNKLGLESFPEDLLEINLQFEKGQISKHGFIDFYKRRFPGISESELIDMWNGILLRFPGHRFSFLKNIDKKYRLFLLSNTNDLHIEYFKNKILGTNDYLDFFNVFEKVYYSHQLKMRKPDPRIYRYILKNRNLIPEETFFVDDTAENTDVAGMLGMHVWNLDPERDDVTDLFNRFSVFSDNTP